MQPEPTHPVPTAGALRLRVRYAECDPFGVAHHSSYVPWLEEGRTELLRATGVTYAHLERAGVFLVITRLSLKYRRPVRYDDLIEIRSRVVGGSRIKIQHEYDIALIQRLGEAPDPTDPATPTDGVCAVATTELACVDQTGRPQALPEWLAGDR